MGSYTFDPTGFPEGSDVEFRILSYSSQSEYRMNKTKNKKLVGVIDCDQARVPSYRVLSYDRFCSRVR